MSKLNAVVGRNTDQAPQDNMSSQTVAFSHYNNLTAQLPIDPLTNKLVPGGIEEQAEQCFKNIQAIIKSLDHRLSDVIRLSFFVKDLQAMDAINDLYLKYFPTYSPARTIVAVDELPLAGALLQIEALVSHGEGTIPDAPQAGDLIKLTNHTNRAPWDGLASQTVAFSHYNNLSAQLPINPKTGRVVAGGIKSETKQALQNIKEILYGIDVPLDDIVKTTIFVKDLADMEAVNDVYHTFFPDSAIARAVEYLPARTVVEVADLPMGASVQIEAVVSHGGGTPSQEIEDRHGIVIWANNTDKAPIDPLSTQTVAFSHYNHLSAQLPIEVKTGKLVSEDIKEQAKQCLTHIQTIVESIDHVLEDVVKVNIYVTDMDEMAIVDEVYGLFFPTSTPARRVVGVKHLPKGAKIQIDAVVGNAEGTPVKK